MGMDTAPVVLGPSQVPNLAQKQEDITPWGLCIAVAMFVMPICRLEGELSDAKTAALRSSMVCVEDET